MNVENFDKDANGWFAVRVRSRHEKLVATMAQDRCSEAFVPLYQRRTRWSDRSKSLESPLFPGYVFCRVDIRHRLPLLQLPGVLHFVSIGKTPASLDEAEIAAIQVAVRSGLHTEPWDYLHTGQRVIMDAGPLVGTEGILVGRSKHEKLVVSVTLLQRSLAVTIEQHWARPIQQARSVASEPLHERRGSFPKLPLISPAA